MVFYCVFFDENESITSQSINVDRKTSEKVIYNVIFLKNSLYNKIENVNKKKKGKQRNNNSKGKNVLILTDLKSRSYKRSILASRRGNNKQMRKIYKNLLKIIIFSNFLYLFWTTITIPKLNMGLMALITLITIWGTRSSNEIMSTVTRSNKSSKSRSLSPIRLLNRRLNLNFCHNNLNFSNKDGSKTTLLTKTLLLRGGIEPNPGPQSQNCPGPTSSPKFLDIVSYNCNRLGDVHKLKRVLDKSSRVTNKGGIVMLQETHITNDVSVLPNYKGYFSINGYKSNSAGVMTLLGPEYVELFSYKDDKGRQLHLVVQKGEDKYLIVNVYYPNDHRISLAFADSVYTKILEILNSYPDVAVIVGDDFNACMTNQDFLNRNKLTPEITLTNSNKHLNDTCSLIDSYRHLNQDPGFTWSRGDCFSRLDYLFISKHLTSNLVKARIDWAFDKSDHGALITTLKLNPEIRKGPGIVKVNPDILDDLLKREQIRDELVFLINQIPDHWNGHLKLEYLKMTLRSTISKYNGVKRAELVDEITSIELSLNDIETLRQKVIQNKVKNSYITLSSEENEQNYQIKLNKVEVAKKSIQNNLEIARKNLEDTKLFNARAKWYEYGERPNKFFLNLNKFRTKQSLLTSIKDG